MLSFLLCLDVLPTRCLLRDSRLFKPDTASFRSCLLLPQVLWHAGGWHLRRKPCVVLLLLLRLILLLVIVPGGLKQPVRNFPSSVLEF